MDETIAISEGTGPHDPIDAFLLECIDAAPGERRDRLAELRRRHPEYGRRVDRLLRLLDEFGFLEDTAESVQGMPERIGEFRVLRRLGSGGMGTVYLAEQPSLGRHVALKVIHPHLVRSVRARERFRREALAASRLDHPAICTLYEVGEADDAPFLVMRLVAGRTLDEHIGDCAVEGEPPVQLPRGPGDSPLDAVLRLVEKLARALHLAHGEGLVHRDVKPGNVMITPDGSPVLLDFGLAVVDSGDDHRLTLSGDHIGTPLYMAPEQVAHGMADARTDVYALGALLYECLTLRTPFVAVSRDSLFQQILREELDDPRRLNQAIGRELAVVLQTAMAKEPDRRYATAAALGDDLARVRHHEPIAARRAGLLLRMRRFVLRHPAAAVALGSLAVGLLVVGLLLQQVSRSLAVARDFEGAIGARESAATDPLAALAQAFEICERTDNAATRSVLYQALASTQELGRFEEHEAKVWRCVFSKDDRYVASCSDDRTVVIRDLRGERAPTTLRHEREVVDLDTDGERLVTASMDGTVKLWRFADGEQLGEPELPKGEGLAGECFRARFSADGDRVVITRFAGSAFVWNIADDDVDELEGLSGAGRECSFSPDGEMVLAISSTTGGIEPTENTAVIWRRDGSVLHTLRGHTGALFTAAFSPDGAHVLTGSADKTVKLWSTADGRCEYTKSGFAGSVRCVRFHPDGDLFAAADAVGNVRVYELDGDLRASFEHDGRVCSLEFSPDGDRILTAAADKSARIHDLHGRLLRTLRGHADFVTGATYSNDGERIATASYDRTVRIWQAEDPESRAYTAASVDEIRTIVSAPGGGFLAGTGAGTVLTCGALGSYGPPAEGGVTAPIHRLAISPSGNVLAAAHDDHEFRLWRDRDAPPSSIPETGATPHDRPAWRHPSLAFLDDTHLLVGRQYGSVAVVDLAGGPLRQLPAVGTSLGRIGELSALSPHPKDPLFASAHWNGRALVRALDGDVVFASGPIHDDWIVDVQFSPSGRRLVTASSDQTAKVWRWTGQALQLEHTLPHDAAVTSASFSPDGTKILTTARDGVARLWSVEEGETWLAIRTGPRALLCGAWSRDGSIVATGSDEGLVHVWPVAKARISTLARERLER